MLTMDVIVLGVTSAADRNIATTEAQQLAVIWRCFADVEALTVFVFVAQNRTLRLASKCRL